MARRGSQLKVARLPARSVQRAADVICSSPFALLILICLLMLVPAACAGTMPPATGEALSLSTAVVPATVLPNPTVLLDPTALPSPTPSPLLPTPVPTPSPSATATPPPAEAAPTYSYEVVAEYPHDPAAWTQGLVFLDGDLIEGTGLRGESSLRAVDLETGEVLRSRSLPAPFFGEGVTVFGDRVYQLTWQEQTGFIYDLDSFEPLGTWSYSTEGWGLTHDGAQLIMSDGTATLYFLDPETLEQRSQVTVTDAGVPVPLLNELEYVDGEVWANVWLTDLIVRVDPNSGQVVGWIDLGGLFLPPNSDERVRVLNGIAYDSENDRLFVTGKWWPKLFEIELVPDDA